MAATNNASDIQTLLRFLAQDAKLPLSKAISAARQLQAASLASPAALATSKPETLNNIFSAPEDAKRVVNAAKRVTKRASAAPGTNPTSPNAARGRKRKYSPTGDAPTPRELEESLKLPDPILDVEVLRQTVLFTNRAPLLLAFAVVLLKYTMPNQPLSSRLSLAQGMVSTGAREKAVNLGLEKGKSAEEEGFGAGQPVVRVMSRDIRVLKRWGYEVEGDGAGDDTGQSRAESSLADTTAANEQKEPEIESKDDVESASKHDAEPALWALDLEALKKSNGGPAAMAVGGHGGHGTGLPIYTPQSARAYILKSFASAQGEAEGGTKAIKGRKPAEEKEANLGLVLGALELLFQSWAETLSHDELNRRAWSWYVAVRPDVEHGISGWGGKGEVRLGRILGLRKST